jgi:RNA:NAD 2'-phosphotransferase (TPT1/KptA family)
MEQSFAEIREMKILKMMEEQNEELIQEICRKCDYSRYEVKNRFIVYFSVENVLPLIGSQEAR